jgi:phosphoribosylanthranilate isomerase
VRLAVPAGPWVKICGVTRPGDAAAAAGLGAAVVGINFWPRSPRFVSERKRAREIAAAARERALVAGVFVDEDPARIEEIESECGLDLVQLHGDEPDEIVARFASRAIRALRAESAQAADRAAKDPSARDQDERLSVEKKGEIGEVEGSPTESISFRWKPLSRGDADADRQPRLQQNVYCWLLDGPAGERRGGTGAAWDWARARPLVAAARAPVLIAGGLRPDNVRRALAATGAAGVDLASGVESAPGVKSGDLMERLFEEVARVRR